MFSAMCPAVTVEQICEAHARNSRTVGFTPDGLRQAQHHASPRPSAIPISQSPSNFSFFKTRFSPFASSLSVADNITGEDFYAYYLENDEEARNYFEQSGTDRSIPQILVYYAPFRESGLIEESRLKSIAYTNNAAFKDISR